MTDEGKPKEQLVRELSEPRQRSAEMEALETRVDQLVLALHRSEAKLSAVFQTTRDSMLISHLGDGSVIDVNHSFLETMGFERDEVEGKAISELECWNSLEDKERFLLGLKKTGERTDLFTTFLSRDGRTIPTHISGRVVEIDGETCIISVLRDISDRVQSEKALRESQRMLQLVMDNIPQAIFWKDRDSVYLGCNRNFAMDAGLDSPEDIAGKTDYDLAWKEEETNFYRECDRRVMENDTPEYHIIEPQLQSDGKQAWLETNKVPLHDSEGKVVGILGTYEDITERMLMEELLEGEQKILEMVATGQPLQETLDALAVIVETLAPGSICSLEIEGLETHGLFHHAHPDLTGPCTYGPNGLDTGAKAGSVLGRAALSKEPVFIEDITTDPLGAEARDMAPTHGLRAFWAVPVRGSTNEVLGSLMVYLRRPCLPGVHDLQLLGTAAHLAGIAAERRQAEQSVRESEEKYRTLFQESRDAIFISSREGRLIDVNQASLDLFGYTREELLQRIPVSELYVDPAARDEYRSQLEGKGSCRDYELKLRKKDGTELDCLLTSSVRYSKDGSILGYQGIIRDVTAYKRAEDALRRNEAQYRAIVEDQTELICRFLPDTTITFVNEAYCKYFNKKREELLGQSFLQFIPSEEHSEMRAHFASLTLDHPVATHEHHVTAPDGQLRWQEWTNRIILDGEGRLTELQSVGRDITEKKAMAAALQNSAEQIKLFAYSISHDLKSPAIAIHGLTKRLFNDQRHALSEKGKVYCHQILKASEQVVTLVEKINLYISTKESPLDVETIELGDTLQLIKDEFAAQLDCRSVKWVQPEIAQPFRADRLGVIRILRNLVDNALKYGGDNLGEIRIGWESSASFYILSVGDDGVGIDMKDSDRIFGLFQRHESAGSIAGTGLGLAIVKAVAEQHAGKAWVESTPQAGTTFYVTISKDL
jgi:PAS domain S-box-containing protein